ncbi:MAG: hypothetical protein ACRDPG_05500 [Nocardioidaceae bacterium]
MGVAQYASFLSDVTARLFLGTQRALGSSRKGVVDVASSSSAERLQSVHERLDVPFRALDEQRQQLDPPGPVFALEHGLSPAEFDRLKTAVRAAVADGFGAVYRTWWLPFVVYAAGVCYD